MDWTFLNKLIEKTKLTGENLHFEKHIPPLVVELASELGVARCASDLLRLEMAVMEYLSYCRFMLMTVRAEECTYKSMDQCARTVERWRNIADRSLTQVRQIFRELEIKNRKVQPPSAGNFFVGPTQINLSPTDLPPQPPIR
ncbi:MAG: hypothetical protein IPL83_04105 [Bdellovibrionales bacterium]|nr:hypothetical protein [Bdellovibrionales bacterium]